MPEDVAEHDVPPGRHLQRDPLRGAFRNQRDLAEAPRLDRPALLDREAVVMTIAAENEELVVHGAVIPDDEGNSPGAYVDLRREELPLDERDRDRAA